MSINRSPLVVGRSHCRFMIFPIFRLVWCHWCWSWVHWFICKVNDQTAPFEFNLNVLKSYIHAVWSYWWQDAAIQSFSDVLKVSHYTLILECNKMKDLAVWLESFKVLWGVKVKTFPKGLNPAGISVLPGQ